MRKRYWVALLVSAVVTWAVLEAVNRLERRRPADDLGEPQLVIEWRER